MNVTKGERLALTGAGHDGIPDHYTALMDFDMGEILDRYCKEVPHRGLSGCDLRIKHHGSPAPHIHATCSAAFVQWMMDQGVIALEHPEMRPTNRPAVPLITII
ncbi:hypothetical protein [Achromobacter aloeverae]